ncbi:MAG: CoA transferase, partial [Candidatus Brocadiia bacterium]|nr:CoA transferase [Candidatus Brocadiia bacterium]
EMWAAVEALQDAGIAAGPVLNAEDLYHDRHLAERDYFEIHDDPDAGEHRYISRPYKLLGTPVTSDRPTPLFGQHNAETLQRLLNLSPDEIATLEADGVIGDQPRQFGR